MSIILLLEMIREKMVNTERIDINYILQYFLTRATFYKLIFFGGGVIIILSCS